MAEQPKISIQKKDKSPTEPLDTKPMTLEEARLLDKQSGGAAALEPKAKTAPVPRKDYTQKPEPPSVLTRPDSEEPNQMIIKFNRFGQIADIEFQGDSALICTSGRMRSWVGNITTRAEIARRVQHQDRIIANEEAAKRAASEASTKKK